MIAVRHLFNELVQHFKVDKTVGIVEGLVRLSGCQGCKEALWRLPAYQSIGLYIFQRSYLQQPWTSGQATWLRFCKHMKHT